MDSESTRLLSDLRAALLKAMTESSEMRRALDRLREYGWSAYVVIDETAEEADAESAPIELEAEAEDLGLDMDRGDLSFLRSLGIDPSPERA